MKVELVYFSGAGNTAYLTALFKQQFEYQGHLVNVHTLERLPVGWQLPDCDIFGFGGPVHFCAPPGNCMEFIRKLDGRGIPLFSYWTMGLYAGDCGRILQLAARDQGFRPIANFEGIFPGVDGVMELHKRSPLNFFNMRIEAGLVPRVHEFVSRLSIESPEKIEAPRWYVPLNDQANRIGMRVYDGFRRSLRSMPERCNHCDWCIRNCPVGAITRQGQELQFNASLCLLCLRCYHACPVEAIQVGEKTLCHGRYDGPQQARHYVPLQSHDPLAGKPRKQI